MQISAIAFDMDDTLLRDDRTVSSYTIDVLRQCAARGISVIPASGRARDSMRPYVDALGCAACYIACNGAELWKPDHTLVFRHQLSVSLVHRLACFAEENGLYAQVYDGPDFLFNRKGYWADQYEQSSMLHGVWFGNLEHYEKPSAKFLMMDTPEKIALMLKKAEQLFGEEAQVTCSKPWFLQINPKEATKGIALERAAELLDFRLEETLAFGDSLNDLSMLKTVGWGVAMGNARDEVKKEIRRACGDNQHDGVAHYIDETLLNGQRKGAGTI